MSTPEPLAKRKRPEDENPAERLVPKLQVDELPIIRSEVFWFDDGNIILEVQRKQYRVHSTILSLHSTIFKDMFSVPQPEDQPKTEGCPVIVLYDWPPDIEHILSLLYHNFRAHDLRDPLPLPLVQAMYRMGRKYDFAYFREEALRRLKGEFPETLDLWDKRPVQSVNFIHSKGFLFDILNFAYDNGILSIIPAASLLTCIVHSLPEITYGVVHEDGRTLSILRPYIMTRSILGRDVLLSSISKKTFGWLFAGDEENYQSEDCIMPKDCAKAIHLLMKSAWNLEMKSSSLALFQAWPSMNEEEYELCSDCHTVAYDLFDVGRRAVWEALTSYFGFHNWQDVKNFEP